MGRRRYRILVVDDESDARNILTTYLSWRGYRADAVPDGMSALHTVIQDPPDAILLDIHMPGTSGLDTLRRLHALDPAVPVIMVSATNDGELAKDALALGAFDYVAKPVDLDYLCQCVETALVAAASRAS
jgi:DNA-binding response OmpR family regulator